MLIYARGPAIIEHAETAATFTIYPDELSWEALGGDERSMGPETIYQAIVDHEELGELRWNLTEYPVGVESVKETDAGKHRIIEDFDYGLEHEQEDHGDPGDLKERIKDDRRWAAAITQSTMVQHLVDWFSHFYEDPANETPYNGAEGGYQYIYGGPYDAEEELRNNFEGLVSDDAIMKAVEKVQSDGTYDWAPTSHHPDKIAFFDESLDERYEERSLDFDQLQERAANSETTRLGSADELMARSEIAELIQELKAALPNRPQRGGIGHNHPPTEFELQGEHLEAVESGLEAIEAELATKVPNIELVAKTASRLQRTVGWLAEKFDKTADEFCKAFGATLGKAAGVGLPAALLALPYWGKLAELLVQLKAWIVLVLSI